MPEVQPHPLSDFQNIALFSAQFSTDQPHVLLRVPMISRDPKTAHSEAHRDRYDINRARLPLEVASVYHNRYGNGELTETAKGELAQAGLADCQIRDFPSIHDMQTWLKTEDEAVNGHMYDAIQDAREWHLSNPENQHVINVRESQGRAIREGRDFDPDYF